MYRSVTVYLYIGKPQEMRLSICSFANGEAELSAKIKQIK